MGKVYEPKIVEEGYIDKVRNLLSVKESELPDEAVSSKMIIGMAELAVIKRVPNFAIVEEERKMELEAAVMYYACYLLCPTIANRIKNKVGTIDVRWEKAKVDWEEAAERFLALFEDLMDDFDSVGDSDLFRIAKMGGGI